MHAGCVFTWTSRTGRWARGTSHRSRRRRRGVVSDRASSRARMGRVPPSDP